MCQRAKAGGKKRVLPPLPLSLLQRNKHPQSRWASALAEGLGGDSPSATPPAIPRR